MTENRHEATIRELTDHLAGREVTEQQAALDRAVRFLDEHAEAERADMMVAAQSVLPEAECGAVVDRAIRYHALRVGLRCTTLEDGTTGWYQRRGDDCWAAAVATCLQVDYDEVPDDRYDEHFVLGVPLDAIEADSAALWDEWLTQRGIRMFVWDTKKLRRLRPERWIGIVAAVGWNHCLVMSGREILFDPVMLLSIKSPHEPTQVHQGISFHPIEERSQ